jgi:peroxiredoxin Q/BCP
MLSEGDTAPDFTLPDQDGNETSLADFAGRTVVLYFYPKADTPGCTTQACSIRDRGSEYTDAGAVVLGVSPDPVDAVKKFHAKQSLNFTLLADADHGCARPTASGASGPCTARPTWAPSARRSSSRRRHGGAGVSKVSPKTHDDVVLAALAELSARGGA